MLNLKNTLDGYLKNVEVIGNTVQDINNLADIRSVGDKVEGQELYKIDVASCGKNLFDAKEFTSKADITEYSYVDGILTMGCDGGTHRRIDYKLPNTLTHGKSYVITAKVTVLECESGYTPGIYCGYGYYTNNSKSYYGVYYPSNNTMRLAFVYDEQGYNVIGFHNEANGGVTKIQWSNIQLEEGTQATPYEPYREDKLEILSPVQLEKVGNVADKIVCKDGVWGVDKKVDAEVKNNVLVNTRTNSEFIPLPHNQQVKLRTFAGQTNIAFLTEIPGQIKAQVPKSLGATVNTHTEQIAELHNSLDRVKKLEETTVSTVETESSFITVDATSNGYFEDVKLEGKTLVNSVMKYDSSQFNLKNAIKQSDGSFKLQHGADVNDSCVIPKYKTHLYKPSTTYTVIVDIKENTAGTYLGVSAVNSPIDSASVIKKDFDNLTGVSTLLFTTRDDITLTDRGVVPSYDFYFGIWKNGGDLSKHITFKYWILEGDHTQNPPEYFEGLMSVGQDVEEVSVESVNENLFKGDVIKNKYLEYHSDTLQDSSVSCTTDYIPIPSNSSIYISTDVVDNRGRSVVIYDKNKQKIGGGADLIYPIKLKTPYNGAYVRFSYFNEAIEVILSTKEIVTYTPHQSNKKPLLYYNPTIEMWEKPILREWDTIEKHSDGKYYYHKRSGEVVLNGSESWFVSRELNDVSIYQVQLNYKPLGLILSDKFSYVQDGTLWSSNSEGITLQNRGDIQIAINKSKLSTQNAQGFKQWLQTNPTTAVYQLAKEEVYECTNIDLMTYSGETNYIINSGAISSKSLLKVHNNISNVVKILQEKVSLLENTFIAGLKSVLSGDMYSLATILYPEDFKQNDNTEQDIMVIPE